MYMRFEVGIGLFTLLQESSRMAYGDSLFGKGNSLNTGTGYLFPPPDHSVIQGQVMYFARLTTAGFARSGHRGQLHGELHLR